jgi:hypothetical protein
MSNSNGREFAIKELKENLFHFANLVWAETRTILKEDVNMLLSGYTHMNTHTRMHTRTHKHTQRERERELTLYRDPRYMKSLPQSLHLKGRVL